MLDVQKIIYDELNKLPYDVYDYVKEDAPFPFVRISSTFSSPNKTKTSKGHRTMQYIDIFSNYKGSKEVKEIIQDIEILLDGAIINGYMISLEHSTVITEDMKAMLPKDIPNKGTIYHGVLIFEIKSY
jgi:hypothetical protein